MASHRARSAVWQRSGGTGSRNAFQHALFRRRFRRRAIFTFSSEVWPSCATANSQARTQHDDYRRMQIFRKAAAACVCDSACARNAEVGVAQARSSDALTDYCLKSTRHRGRRSRNATGWMTNAEDKRACVKIVSTSHVQHGPPQSRADGDWHP